MIRVILSMLVFLSSTAFLHAQAECTRSMLQAAAASYIAAQTAGDLSKRSLASKVMYMEDMIETTKDKGL